MRNLLLIFLIISIVVAQDPLITVVTEDFKPYNYLDENGELTGPTTKIIQALLDSCGYPNHHIIVYPWARAYSKALSDENTLIFSMVKTEERDTLFKWVGEVATVRMGAIRLRSRKDLQLDSVSQLRNYRITTFIDSPFDSYLKTKEIPISNRVGNYLSTIKLLIEERVDFTPASVEGFLSTAEQAGYPRDLFEVALRFPELEKGLWVAFSNETSDTLVEKFREALERIVADKEK